MRAAALLLPDLRSLLREAPDTVRDVLDEFHPEDLADLVEGLDDEEAAKVLAQLPAEIASNILERCEGPRQKAILEFMDVPVAARLLAPMSADDRVDVVQELEPEDRRSIVAALPPEEAREVRALEQFAENTAGGLMTTDYLSVADGVSVRDAIETVRARGREVETIYNVYVVHGNDEDLTSPPKLRGVASLRDLLLAAPEARIQDVMTENVISVTPETDQEEVARTLAKYDLSSLPVADRYGRLLGVITFDDVMDVLVAEQSEDVQKLGGVDPVAAGYFDVGFWRFISARARWLVALFFGELFTSTALSQYEDAFKSVATLVLFIPLVISSGGNSGSQSATLVIQGMANGQISDSDAPRVLTREIGQGMVLGLILGAIGFLRAMLWRPDAAHRLPIAITVACTLVAVVTIGTVVGAMLPMLLRRLRFDPAVSSTPFIASLVDVLGIVAYFSVARTILGAVIHHVPN